MNKLKVYALYRDDELIAVGDIHEMEELLNRKASNIRSVISKAMKGQYHHIQAYEIEEDEEYEQISGSIR